MYRDDDMAAHMQDEHETLMQEFDCVMRSHPQINLVDVMAHFDIGADEAHELLKAYREWLQAKAAGGRGQA